MEEAKAKEVVGIHIEGFLGYTDNKKPGKSRIEKLLTARGVKYGDVYFSTRADFVCGFLLAGYIPLVVKGDGRAAYRLSRQTDERTNVFVYITKAEYAFAVYVQEQGFDSREKILSYDRAEQGRNRLRDEEQRRAEEEKHQEKLREEEERKAFDQWLCDEVGNLPAIYQKLVEDVYEDQYGADFVAQGLHARQYSVAVCVLHFEENSRCKGHLKECLHTDNSASRKIFNLMTGLKLPGTNKETRAFLDRVRFAEFQIPQTEVQVPKKRERRADKEHPQERFYVCVDTGEAMQWVEVFAEPLKAGGLDLFIRKDVIWRIRDRKTGFVLVSGDTKTDCMEKLRLAINNIGIERIVKQSEKTYEKLCEDIGPNPLYAGTLEDPLEQSDLFEEVKQVFGEEAV